MDLIDEIIIYLHNLIFAFATGIMNYPMFILERQAYLCYTMRVLPSVLPDQESYLFKMRFINWLKIMTIFTNERYSEYIGFYVNGHC